MSIENSHKERVLWSKVLDDLHRVLHVGAMHSVLVLLVGNFVVKEVGVVGGEVGTRAFSVHVTRGVLRGGGRDEGGDGVAEMVES
jgi:hypothetical protein